VGCRRWAVGRKRDGVVESHPAHSLQPTDHSLLQISCPSRCARPQVMKRTVSSATQAQGLGGVFRRSIASSHRAGGHGWTPRAGAEQECTAQCARRVRGERCGKSHAFFPSSPQREWQDARVAFQTTEPNRAGAEPPASGSDYLPARLLRECCVRRLDRPYPYTRAPSRAWYRPRSWSRVQVPTVPSRW